MNSEWDTERVLEVNSGLLILLTSYLGMKTSRFWYLVTGVIGVFLLQHALQGWCPPLPMIRRWGVRTEDEINSEKMALKLMRGDFKAEGSTVIDILSAVEKQ